VLFLGNLFWDLWGEKKKQKLYCKQEDFLGTEGANTFSRAFVSLVKRRNQWKGKGLGGEQNIWRKGYLIHNGNYGRGILALLKMEIKERAAF